MIGADARAERGDVVGARSWAKTLQAVELGVVGRRRRRSDAPSRSTMRSACGRGEQLREDRARRSGSCRRGAPTASAPGLEPHRRAPAPRRRAARPVGERIVEMQDAHALAPDLQHVEIAIGVEGIARVVAGDHHVDAGGAAVRAARSRRASAACGRRAGPAGTVAHRQRDDADARPRDELDRALARRRRPAAPSEQQWPTRMWPGKRALERGLAR